MFGAGRAQGRILRMWRDIAAVFRGAAELKAGLTGLFTVARDGDGGKVVAAVRKAESKTESAVRPQFDRTIRDRDSSVRLSRAINDQLGIDLEPKLSFLRKLAAGGTAHFHFACGSLFTKNGAPLFPLGNCDRSDLFLKLAANQFSDLHGTHPDAAQTVDMDEARESVAFFDGPFSVLVKLYWQRFTTFSWREGRSNVADVGNGGSRKVGRLHFAFTGGSEISRLRTLNLCGGGDCIEQWLVARDRHKLLDRFDHLLEGDVGWNGSEFCCDVG